MIGIDRLLDFLFPAFCLSCGKRLGDDDVLICDACMEAIPKDYDAGEYYNGRRRLHGLVPFTEYYSDLIFSRHSPTRLLLHQIKYHGHPEAAYLLAKRFGERHRDLGHYRDISLIIPIPLAPGRLRERGYNQSLFIAKGLGEALDVPFRDDLLARRDVKGTQTKRSKSSRWDEMEGLFYLKDPSQIAGKRILIVDDLLTSGSTLIHAAYPLLDGELHAESVSFYTLMLDYLLA